MSWMTSSVPKLGSGNFSGFRLAAVSAALEVFPPPGDAFAEGRGGGFEVARAGPLGASARGIGGGVVGGIGGVDEGVDEVVPPKRVGAGPASASSKLECGFAIGSSS